MHAYNELVWSGVGGVIVDYGGEVGTQRNHTHVLFPASRPNE